MESVDLKPNLRHIFDQILEQAPYRERQELPRIDSIVIT